MRLAWGIAVAFVCAAVVVAVGTLVPQPGHADPAKPAGKLTLVGSNPLMNRGMNSALAVHGHHAYIGSRTDGSHPNAGVMVVDVQDPAYPKVVGQIGQPEEANPGESSRELRVWHRQNLLIVMNFGCDEVGHACAGSGGAKVVPTFRFYDIAGEHAAAPKLVASYEVSQNPHEFFLWQDPKRPQRALMYITTPFTSGADIDRSAPHLVVTDISKARDGKFEEIATFTPEREEKYKAAGLHSLSVSPDGSRAYLADLEGGFLMADTSDLARGKPSPQVRQLTPAANAVHHEEPGVHSALPIPGRKVALIDDEVYGAAFGAAPVIGFNVLKGCPWGWARFVDTSDPTAPRIVSEYKVEPYNDPAKCPDRSPTEQNGASFSSHNPTLTEHLALLTWHSAGVQVASTADPTRPVQTAQFIPEPVPAVVTEDPALSAGTVKVVMWSYPILKDGLVYVVDIRNGLYILRYQGPYADELGCYGFLEGNSTVTERRPSCGLHLTFRARCSGGRLRMRLGGADVKRIRSVRFRAAGTDNSYPYRRSRRAKGRRARAAVTVTTKDGSRIALPSRRVRCGHSSS